MIEAAAAATSREQEPPIDDFGNGALFFGISHEQTQHALFRLHNGELDALVRAFR